MGSLTGAESWTTSGRSLQTQASSELTAAREKQHVDATWDQSAGKLKSAWGMVTGDQDAQTEGNLRAEKGNWNEALSQGKVLPEGGIETVKAKAQTCVPFQSLVPLSRRLDTDGLCASSSSSAVGIVTGDSDKQNEGNLKVEKAHLLGK